MKPHLPLSLRSALLASLIAFAYPATAMAGDTASLPPTDTLVAYSVTRDYGNETWLDDISMITATSADTILEDYERIRVAAITCKYGEVTIADSGYVQITNGTNSVISNTQTVTIDNNEYVEIYNNQAYSNAYGSSATCAPIVNSGTFTISGTWNSVAFFGNAAGCGFASSSNILAGAIYNAGDFDILGNNDVIFSFNRVNDSIAATEGTIVNTRNFTIGGNVHVLFASNRCTNNAGAIYNSGVYIIEDNDVVEFSGNSAGKKSACISNEGTMTISGNGLVSVQDNQGSFNDSYSCGFLYNAQRGSLRMTDNDKLYFANNSGLQTGVFFAYGDSGEGCSLRIDGNREVIFEGNQSGTGGGVYESYLGNQFHLCKNGSVIFRNNISETSGAAIHNTKAAISTKALICISGNDEVVFRGNYVRKTNRLEGVYIEWGSLHLAAGEGQKIYFYDTLTTSDITDLELNHPYEGVDGGMVEATGEIVFSGRYAAMDLQEMREKCYLYSLCTEEEIASSQTSTIGKATTLHSGSLTVRDKAVLNAQGITVQTSAATEGGTRISLKNGTLNSDTLFEESTSLQISGTNSMSGTLALADGAGLAFCLAEATDAPLLTLTGTMVQEGVLNIDITGPNVTDHYALLTCTEVFDQSKWNAAHVLVSGASFDDLTWTDGTLYLTVTTPPPSVPQPEEPDHTQDDIQLDGKDVVLGDGETLRPGRITITGDADSSISGRGSIAGDGDLDKYGKGTLTIGNDNPDWSGNTNIHEGKVAAGSDTALGTGDINLLGGDLDMGGKALGNNVNVFADATIEGGGRYEGRLTLNEGTLDGDPLHLAQDAILKSGVINNDLTGPGGIIKTTNGTVTLNGDNTYAGGTTIEGGMLIAGSRTALGTGDVTLNGGSLNMGGWMFGNTIIITKDSELYGAGDFQGTLVLRNGTLSGGSVNIENGKIFLLENGEVQNKFIGEGGVYKVTDGTVTLAGRNSYEGDTVVEAGKLVVSGALTNSAVTVRRNGALEVTGSVKNDILVDGGTLGDYTLHAGQTLTLNGGKVDGSLATVANSTLTTTGTVAVTGDVELGGGVWNLAPDSMLNIGGRLILTGKTELDISGFEISETPYTIATYSGLTGDLSWVTFTGGASNARAGLTDTGNGLQLSVIKSSTTICWKAGVKGYWKADGEQAWDFVSGVQGDNRFHNGNEVIFDSKATVTIAGNVDPWGTIVQVLGRDTLTFKGTGSIVGEGSLTMDGTGKFNLNAVNAYTGGTVIRSGTVKATGALSFGTGAITLYGGTLNLGDLAVTNAIMAKGGTLTGGKKYSGKLSVDGFVTLKGTLHALEMVLSGGTLTGGTIKDSNITVDAGTLASAISGKSCVTVRGDALLSGKLSYTGNTTLDGGMLASDFRLASKKTLTVNSGVIAGNLTLTGGSIVLTDNSSLRIAGALNIKSLSTLDISSLNGTATITFKSLTGNTAKLLTMGMPKGMRKIYTLDVQPKSITVTASGVNADLVWQGYSGSWEVLGKRQWTGTSSDNRFYQGDNVTFDSTAKVTLVNKLAPGSVVVTGDGAVVFAGSGNISGATGLTMDGSNTLKLNATNSYTGGTTINSGTVTVTGAASFGAGDVSLNGGTLNLASKAVGNNILVGGDASIINGKAYTGAVTIGADSTLHLDANLTGTLVLDGGTLDLSQLTARKIAKLQFGTVVTGSLTTINVGTLGTGTYTVMNLQNANGINTDLLQVEGMDGYFELHGNKLVLVVGRKPLAGAEPQESVDPKPQEAVAIEEERLVAATPVPQHAELPGAGLYTTMMRAQMDGNRAAFDSIRQLMGTGETSSADGRYRFAAQATSASTDMKDYRRQGFGGLVMVEEVFSSKAVCGLSLNYEHADINPDGAGKYESDDTRVNAHLLVSSKNWQSRSIAGIGIHDYDVNHASATGHSFNLMEEVSRTIAVDDKSVIAPFVRVETGYNVIGSINDGVLSIDKQTAWSTDVTLGARFVKTCDFGSVMLEAGVTKSIGDQGGAIGASLVDDPATRAALSPSSRNRWSAVLGGSVQVPVGERSSLNAGATLRFHGGTTEVNANVGYSIKF